jgi:uncharacterized membrane protein YfcA
MNKNINWMIVVLLSIPALIMAIGSIVCLICHDGSDAGGIFMLLLIYSTICCIIGANSLSDTDYIHGYLEKDEQ